jgi:hypothetical protein
MPNWLKVLLTVTGLLVLFLVVLVVAVVALSVRSPAYY